jgi:hypothetical protein
VCAHLLDFRSRTMFGTSKNKKRNKQIEQRRITMPRDMKIGRQRQEQRVKLDENDRWAVRCRLMNSFCTHTRDNNETREEMINKGDFDLSCFFFGKGDGTFDDKLSKVFS